MSFEQMCIEFAEQLRRAVAPKDNMMKLVRIEQGEGELFREFIKRYHQAVLELRAFNHPQALKELKKKG